MNRVVLMGRLTKEPELRYTQGETSTAVARYTLAVDRRGKEKQADFIQCVAFGKAGEFAQKYFTKGQRVLVSGRIQTGSYTNKEGQKVYTTDVIVDDQEFADSKSSGSAATNPDSAGTQYEDFMAIPEGEEDGIPFI